LVKPRAWRRFLRSERVQRIACWVTHCYIRFVYLTNRWSVEGGEWPRRLTRDGRTFIVAFWHGRLLMMPLAWHQLTSFHMLISAHRDGRIIAGAMTYFGIETIAGSTARGGSSALRAMLKRLKEGGCVGITPDGPRGPAMTVSVGTVNIARLARVPVLPLAYATSRRRVLATWDRFHLALPFGRGVFLWGEPIEIAGELDEAGMENFRGLLETRMVEMVREAERLVGHRPHPCRPDKRGTVLPLYRTLTRSLAPLVRLYLAWRRRQGKEDMFRFRERRGIASKIRPPGPLVWIHAASVGEATAMLALIDRLRETRPGLEILVTTGTVASAHLLEQRLPPGAQHQFVPVDVPRWVVRFLDHWRPDLALWVESELWPNLVLATRARGVPMVLLNGRLSVRSYARWRWWPGLIGPVLGAFALCLAQDEDQAERLRRLGAPELATLGDLKAAAAVLPVDPMQLERLRRRIGSRPLWLAASTHAGEEEIVASVHSRLAATHPGLLTIIAPRHPARGDAIATMLAARGLRAARRRGDEPITDDTDIYLADTLGELGLFYSLAGIAFIGGSLVPKGGHNPFEAARLGCAVLHGPNIGNCAGMAAELAVADAAETVHDADGLARAVAALLGDRRLRAERAAAGKRVAAAGLGILDKVLTRLAPWLDPLVAVEHDASRPRRLRA
jgi:3-deoxy-D-manno-octulosonic-acid transferase